MIRGPEKRSIPQNDGGKVLEDLSLSTRRPRTLSREGTRDRPQLKWKGRRGGGCIHAEGRRGRARIELYQVPPRGLIRTRPVKVPGGCAVLDERTILNQEVRRWKEESAVCRLTRSGDGVLLRLCEHRIQTQTEEHEDHQQPRDTARDLPPVRALPAQHDHRVCNEACCDLPSEFCFFVIQQQQHGFRLQKERTLIDLRARPLPSARTAPSRAGMQLPCEAFQGRRRTALDMYYGIGERPRMPR